MTLSSGDRFSRELKVLSSGLACVNIDNETISVGPVICDDGTQVELRYLGERDLENMDVSYAICLDQDAIDRASYEEYLDNIIDLLTPEGDPENGTITYLQVDEVDPKGIGYATPGGSRFTLGPTSASEDSFVQVEVITNEHAKILHEDQQGDNYDIRFWLLSKQYQNLPIEINEEYTTAVAEFDGETRICYVKNIPIRVDCGAELGQKVDIEITNFERDTVVGKATKIYSVVVRTNNPGEWARKQWLKEAGVEDPPLQSVTSEFIGVKGTQLPEKTEQLKTILTGEAVRLCLAEKAEDSSEDYPRAHVTGIKHWIEHKLEPLLGTDEDSDIDWFREALDEGTGPTLTFLGDILKLSKGYFASGPTRVIPTNDSTWILVSGLPTKWFREQGLQIEFRGLSRAVIDTTRTELKEIGLRQQSQEEYIGKNTPSYDEDYLTEFIDGSEPRDWQADSDWDAYVGKQGFGLSWGDEPLEVQLPSGSAVSIWREPIEYGGDEYYLRLTDDDSVRGIRLPRSQYKSFCLLLEALNDSPRGVEILQTPTQGTIQLAMTFSPPQPQYRWLVAIGAEWRGFQNNRIQWIIPTTAADSVVQAFEWLPVTINDER